MARGVNMVLHRRLCIGSWMQMMLCHNKDDLQTEAALTYGENDFVL